MTLNYNSLPPELQDYLSTRFSAYGLDPELAYDHLVPVEVKIQGADAIEEFMQHKHISHIYPSHHYPEMNDNLSNIFLEDSAANLSRGDQIATSEEVFQAKMDASADAWDGDFDDNGILDGLEGIS